MEAGVSKRQHASAGLYWLVFVRADGGSTSHILNDCRGQIGLELEENDVGDRHDIDEVQRRECIKCGDVRGQMTSRVGGLRLNYICNGLGPQVK